MRLSPNYGKSSGLNLLFPNDVLMKLFSEVAVRGTDDFRLVKAVFSRVILTPFSLFLSYNLLPKISTVFFSNDDSAAPVCFYLVVSCIVNSIVLLFFYLIYNLSSGTFTFVNIAISF